MWRVVLNNLDYNIYLLYSCLFKVQWPVTEKSMNMCTLKGKSKEVSLTALTCWDVCMDAALSVCLFKGLFPSG